MALKIWNIGKANAEIDRLTGELAAVAKERDDLKAAIESNKTEVSAEAETLQASFTASQARVTALEAELVTAKADAEAKAGEIKALSEKLAAKDAEVEVKVSRRLMEQQAVLGQPDKPTAAGISANSKPLFGIQRVIAAEKAESETRNSQKH